MNTRAQQIELSNIENATPGEEVLISMNFTSMSDVGGMSIYINYDPEAIEFVEVINTIPELTQNVFLFNTIASPPQIALSWFDLSGAGVDFPDGKVLDLKVNYLGGSSSLEFNSSCEITNSAFLPIDVTYINGAVSGNTGSNISVWNGTGNWMEETNWSNGIPGSETEATIQTGEVNIASGAICKTLAINEGATLNVIQNHFLTVMEGFSLEGTMNILSDQTGSGSFISNGSVNISGDFNANLYLAGDGSTSHFISSPVQAATASVFGGNQVSSFDETSGAWQNIGSSDPLILGAGYSVAGNNGQTVTFTGEFNYLDVDLSGLSYTENSGSDWPAGFNLVGNPFTSAIDWDKEEWVKQQIHSSIYLWNGYNYSVWNGYIGSVSDGVIPAGQGFFVVALNSNAQLTISAGSRIHSTEPFYKDQKEIEKLLVLKLSGNDIEDFCYIQFDVNAGFGFDEEYDAFKLMGLDEAPQIYSFTNTGVKTSINVFPTPENVDTTFAIGMNIPSQGDYTIERTEFSIYGFPIYLHDLTTDDTANLKTDSVYTFTSEAGTIENRFVIEFKKPFSIDEISENDFSLFVQSNRLRIISSTYLGDPALCIYDLNGRLLQSEKLLPGIVNQSIQLKVHKGIYIITVSNGNASVSRKIFIQ